MSDITPRSQYVKSIKYTTLGSNVGGPLDRGINDYSQTLRWDDSVTKGANVPNWKRVIASGGNATTSMSGIRRQFKLSEGYAVWYRTHPTDKTYDIKHEYEGSMNSFEFPSTQPTELDLTTARNQAWKRYYNHIQSTNVAFKGLVFAGELRESLSLILSPAKKLRNAVSLYLRRLKKDAPRIKRKHRPLFVAGTWLEFSLGAKPLISDIDQAIKAFYSSDAVRPIFQMVTGKGSHKFLGDPFLVQGSNGVQIIRIVHRVEYETFVKIFGIQHSTGNGISNIHHFGFDPSEFAPTIWELIPHSFLVDYFTNIGDIVSSWAYRNVVNGWTAELTRRSVISHTTFTPESGSSVDAFNNIYTWGGTPGSQESESVHFTRTPSIQLDVPSLEFQLPGFGTKWVNVLALGYDRAAAREALRR